MDDLATQLTEHRLATLEPATRIVLYMADAVTSAGERYPGFEHHGTLLWIGPGSVEVALDKDGWSRPKDNEGKAIKDATALPNTTRLPLDCGAYLECEFNAAKRAAEIRRLIMATKAKKKVAAPAKPVAVTGGNVKQKALLQARYNSQLKRLETAEDEDTITQISESMAKIEAEANAVGVQLDGVTAPTPEPTDEAITPPAPAKVAQAKRTDAVQAHANAVAAAKPKREKKVKQPQPCLDGCGAMVPGNFQMGHDAKLKSLILKVERGEEGLEVIPEVTSELITFVKAGVEQEKDENGKVTSTTQLYRCIKAPVQVHPEGEEFAFGGKSWAFTKTARAAAGVEVAA